VRVNEIAFVILSGGYVGAELVAEFGHLPPSMLPNGGKPLYEAQCDMADALGASVFLVLPHDYVVPLFDRARLATRGVTTVAAPPEATILQSLKAGLSAADGARETFLLFGDTLVPRREFWPCDSFAAGETQHVAVWAEYLDDGDGCRFRRRRPGDGGEGGHVVAGFFHFGDANLLGVAAEQGTEIVDLLNVYAAERPLHPVSDADWLDFGHLFTYHQSRCRELLARSFNSVTSDGHSVIKSGTPARKIYAEAEWYKQLPSRMRPYTPHFMETVEGNHVSYEVEYLYLPLVSELYGFGQLPRSNWTTILGSCQMFLQLMQSSQPPAHRIPADYAALFYSDMIGNKTRARATDFARERSLCMDREWTFNGSPYLSLNGLVERLTAMIRPTERDDIALWHGDFHFGNIFYDFRSRKVRVVDPRGLLPNGMLTIYGDARYDISKLGHSVYGLYDFLIADRYILHYDGGYGIDLDFGENLDRDDIIEAYSAMKIGRYATADQEAIAMVALLFLSMLPLHAKDETRQTALLGNAMRLTMMAEAA
jgi:hypothetical protein